MFIEKHRYQELENLEKIVDEYLSMNHRISFTFNVTERFQDYLNEFKRTETEKAERAKIEKIIMDLVKKSALKE